jgi:uncharacterized protein YecT (DUF1311 family)
VISLKSLALVSIILLTFNITYAKAPSIEDYNWGIALWGNEINHAHATMKTSDFSNNPRNITAEFQDTSKGTFGCLSDFDFVVFQKAEFSYKSAARLENEFDDSEIVEIDCTSAAATQDKMNHCTQRQAQHSAQQLEKLLTELQYVLNGGEALWIQFEKLNKAWEQFREQYCLQEMTLFGFGTVAPMVYHNCITFCNTQRLWRLKRVLCESYGIADYC